MRDTMDILQTAVYTTLSGFLFYPAPFQAQAVPVYDEKQKVAATDNFFVVLSTQQESENRESNDCTFMTDSSIDIEILLKTDYEVSKKWLNNVSNQILQLLLASPYSKTFADPSGWQMLNLRRERAITRNFSITDTQSVVGKIITMSCLIVQQNP